MLERSGTVELPSPFRMHGGGALVRAALAYETWGEPGADGWVLIFTGLSPGAHVASHAGDPSPGWWEAIVGPGKAIDTNRHRVICFNSLGSCKGSTGPASLDPDTGNPYRARFPDLALEDIAAAAAAGLERLGIGELTAVVGPSMGGMSALAFAAQQPGRSSRYLLISSGMRADPFAIAIRALQRELIWSDPAFASGSFDDPGALLRGMRLARKLGVISYRGAEEWRQRFGRSRLPATSAGFGPEFAIEGYLDGHADRFAPNFDPLSYLQLSRAMDRFDFADSGDGDLVAAAHRCRIREMLVIGVTTDILFPLSMQQQLATTFSASGSTCRLAVLPSPQGHDAFLVDIPRFAPLIGGFLHT